MKKFSVMVIILAFSIISAFCAQFETKIGNASVYVISLQKGLIPNERLVAFSKSDEKLIAAPRSQNEHNIILIKSNNAVALIDTGYAHTIDKLESELAQLNLTPKDITHIIITHAHPDHIGGLLKDNQKTFANAKMLIDKLEYEYWMKQDNNSTKNALNAYKKLYFDHDKNLIESKNVGLNIRAIKAYGHTPGHNMILLESNDEKLIFVADIFHAYEAQIKNPKIALTFDVDKTKAIATRELFLRDFKGVDFVGAHMPTSEPIRLK